MTPPRPSLWPVAGGVLALLCFAALGLLGWQWLAGGRAAPVPYAEFQRLLAAGQIERVVVRETGAAVTLTAPAEVQVNTVQGVQPRELRDFSVQLPSSLALPGSRLMNDLNEQGVQWRFEPSGPWPGLLLNGLPPLLFLALFVALPLTLLILLAWRARRPKVVKP
ncbi:hypothetical protein GO986_16965 [Deinococcus sp. HMF7620]|uniref:Peptidase M41 FtsH extracellular domain-containing protein n=1 Tax=Deinococcus arboris TaxID=2682977 RepID=A0A7C9I176_9DEIO|nr:ATP-dependent metallopeptidase FtsH/Yme1/Tma family protein [Deinococcus arboris]MVN88435.1 hypothetical protein [Deinococcus arboris]